MAENLELSHGVVYSQRVLLRLTDAGLPRQAAYEIVQQSGMRAWKERRSFFDLLAAVLFEQLGQPPFIPG